MTTKVVFIKDVATFLSDLTCLLAEWKRFGAALEIPDKDLKPIKGNLARELINYYNVFETLLEFLERQEKEKCTIKNLADVLENDLEMIGYAGRLVDRFGSESHIAKQTKVPAKTQQDQPDGGSKALKANQTPGTAPLVPRREKEIAEVSPLQSNTMNQDRDPSQKSSAPLEDAEALLENQDFWNSWKQENLDAEKEGNEVSEDDGLCFSTPKLTRECRLINVDVKPVLTLKREGFSSGSNPRGRVLIINIIDFHLHRRTGAEADGQNLQSLFYHMGFDITYRMNIATSEGLENEIKKFKELFRTENEVDLCIVVVMSHGGNNLLQLPHKPGQDLKLIDMMEDIVFKFKPTQNLPDGLKEIPKLFFLLTCRKYESDRVEPDMTNTLVVYPCSKGELSFRDLEKGTLFGYFLTKVFMEKAWSTDLLEMLETVKALIKKAAKKKFGVNQQPEWVPYGFDLSKKLYFNPKSFGDL